MFHWFKKHTADGLEKPDSTPIEVNLPKPLTLAEQIVRFTSNPQNAQYLQAQGMDTFDQADDLDVDEDEDNKTPYEVDFNGTEMPVQTRMDEIHGQMVEEMPVERQFRAYERLKPKKRVEEPPPLPKP